MLEQLLADSPSKVNVLDYVSSFCERLHHAWKAAKQAMATSQVKMKQQFDENAMLSNLELFCQYLAQRYMPRLLGLILLRGNGVTQIW